MIISNRPRIVRIIWLLNIARPGAIKNDANLLDLWLVDRTHFFFRLVAIHLRL